MNHGIGHNRGPTLEPGQSWRRISWQKARDQLLPNLPIEIVRLRVKRAQALGLPYRTYAGIRAASGRDVIGFLFSSNALRMLDDEGLPPDRAARLAAMRGADRVALVHPPRDPDRVAAPLDAAFAAPGIVHSWSETAAILRAALRARGLPCDGTVIVGDTDLERDWLPAARAAGYLGAEQLFPG
ncbi:MAG: SAP domain [Rhodobacteraceae bacterium HLUCCA08]|nr:MAG: SAP domain [Rhodobacteraceae bacterium HLUCCA08]